MLFGSEIDVASTETVEVRSLDSMLVELETSLNLGNVFVKLDTQGSDLDVIRGGSQALPSLSALQTELSFVPIYQGMPSYQEMLTLLTASGFEIGGFFPVNHDNRLRLVEADCVLVNRCEPSR